jgi:hypothetical protein
LQNELAALANTGATALIGLMVSDSWAQVKVGFARLFTRSAATASTLRSVRFGSVIQSGQIIKLGFHVMSTLSEHNDKCEYEDDSSETI